MPPIVPYIGQHALVDPSSIPLPNNTLTRLWYHVGVVYMAFKGGLYIHYMDHVQHL